MNTQSQQLAYVTPSSYMNRNGSQASLLDDDQPWGSYLQPPFQNVYEESQLYYQNSGQDFNQSDTLLPNWASEDQDEYTHAANLNTSSPSNQSLETRVQPAASNFGKSNGQKNFVRKLYDMLSDDKANAYIYWNSDGKSFTIENQEVFAKKVLKNYLKTDNFQSFIRQLNMYDFHKINRAQRAQRGVQSQTPQYVFSHTKFIRGELELLSEIKRKGTEQQDAPPQYETLPSAGKFVVGTAPNTQPVLAIQPDFQLIIFQAEIQNLRGQLAQLQAAYEKLQNEHNSLKTSFQVPTTMAMPQVQDTPTSSTTSYQPFYGGDASHQALQLNPGGNSFDRKYPTSAPETTEAPVSFQKFTESTHQSNTNQATGETSPIAIRRRLSNAPAPDTSANPQPATQRPRGPPKPRPASWVENVGQWLTDYLPVVGGHYEPGPSASVNAIAQDAHATPGTSYGRPSLGGRNLPVVMADKRRPY